MIRYAVTTFAGTETDSVLSRRSCLQGRGGGGHRRQAALHWKRRRRGSPASAPGEAVLTVDVRDARQATVPGIEVSARLVHPLNSRLDRNIVAATGCRMAAFRGATDAEPGQWTLTLEVTRDRRAPLPLGQPAGAEMTRPERRDYSHFTHRAHADGSATMDMVVDGIHCGGCIGRIERSLKALDGVSDARLNFTSKRLTLTWNGAGFDPGEAIRSLERMGYRANPFAGQIGRRQRGEAIEIPAALPCGRGLRRDEHHAAVGVGLVRQCHRHHAGDARPVPLAVGGDRAAGRGLCRPAVLPQRLQRAALAPASTWMCRSRSAFCWRSACRSTRPRITPSMPISIPRSC